MPGARVCPVCNRGASALAVPASKVIDESSLRESFVKERLGRPPEDLEAMDLTEFMHGGPGQLLRCENCGTLLRDEVRQANYQDDVYDSVLMRHLYPRYLRAFEEKQPLYRNLLRDGAEIVEVGSHLGAFLQAAEEWRWRPTGLDIGSSTSTFARQQDLTVKRLELEDYLPELRRPEAVFIWNCFEQLDDPAAALKNSHQLLDRHGLLVIRVPNADFYERQLRNPASKRTLQLLGYNNLLGFPYLHGYTTAALERLLRRNGFAPVTEHNSSLLTPPYPDLSPRIRHEWKQARREGESAAAGTGPWIEIVSRRIEAN